ncbi:MAG: plastocyanin/azurin family copper-binding protein [Halodesulfurarchaeum sp.]|nr:plastocyanin/azurin family copper-binding protein [Halodesulfurarchaeum sp.]
MTHRREFLRTAVAGGLVLVAGCAGGGSDTGNGTTETGPATVSMTDSQFDPRNIEVDAGTTVTWTNDSGMDHTVTSASTNWEKDTVVASGEETTHTFEESGVYEVYCAYHGSADLSGMSMKVGVGDATIEEPLGESSDDDGGGLY